MGRRDPSCVGRRSADQCEASRHAKYSSRAVDALPVAVVPWISPQFGIPLYQLGLLTPAFNKHYQRLGDLACGTMVIFEERPWQFGVTRITEPEALRLAELIPLDFEVSRDLSRVLSMYVDRRRRFSFGRRAEIARHLSEPLRIRFNLPAQTNGDLLLCALYQRAFFGGVGGTGAKSARSTGAMNALPVEVPAPNAGVLTSLGSAFGGIDSSLGGQPPRGVVGGGSAR